jgi:tetratricopeptide (TPR) repeat protein
MKTLVMTISSGLMIGGGILLVAQLKSSGSRAEVPGPELSSANSAVEPVPAGNLQISVTNPSKPQASEESVTPAQAPTQRPTRAASVPSQSLPFQQALDILVSPQSAYAQKQAAWNHLRDSGKLDQAISELEQRASSNPSLAEYPATLGQAYLQKAGTLKDIREQGILGMKADQSFDAALSIDPSNWEAGFWKALALSYWPPQLNKAQEVIERFVEVIKLQESQSPQPQFAQSYLVLGEQYQKQGYADYAKQIWQRGAGLFPSDAKLAEKTSAPSATQQAANR